MKRGIVFGIIFLALLAGVFSQEGFDLNETRDDFREKTNDALAKQIEIPDNFQLAARIVFGLREDDRVDLQTFIVLISLWVILLLLLHTGLEIIFMGWKSWVFAVVVTGLAALAGAVREAAKFFFGFGNLFGFFGEWGLFRLFFVIIILAFIFYFLAKLLKSIKNKAREESAEQTGQEIGFLARIARISRRIRGR